jgi:GNAT superfamily N-acetyltransferase
VTCGYNLLNDSFGGINLIAPGFGEKPLRGDMVEQEPMINTPVIRAFAPHEWGTYKDLRLRALADSPDAFGGTLAQEKDRSDTEWSNRLASGVESRWDLPLVAELGKEPIGLAWGRIETSNLDVLNLYQMWVAPNSRAIGAGQMLLEAVITWAGAMNMSYLALVVTCGDSPAMRLYVRAGFEPVGEPEPLRPGSEIMAQPMRLALRTAALNGFLDHSGK